MTTTPRVLITDATGNIVRARVTQLTQAAPALEVVDASPKGETVAGAAGQALNLRDAASAQAAMHGIDCLFLLTPAHPEMETMTVNAVLAAQAAGVRHIVRVSGAGADAEPDVAIARLQGRRDRIVIDIRHTLSAAPAAEFRHRGDADALEHPSTGTLDLSAAQDGLNSNERSEP